MASSLVHLLTFSNNDVLAEFTFKVVLLKFLLYTHTHAHTSTSTQYVGKNLEEEMLPRNSQIRDRVTRNYIVDRAKVLERNSKFLSYKGDKWENCTFKLASFC